ncbi:MAG: 2-C-methyl-D-erythritol 4-phosphate cytidylyltransferase, partial [Candidatus Omnitrophica bacterium]|nr:2-C-methyl-D-erythritol 4-phosphate cytidylyltransferase [Candidatus Omnitrophota bacterium]
SQLVELMGEKIKIVEGGVTNFKITYPEDVSLAKLILSNRNLKKCC